MTSFPPQGSGGGSVDLSGGGANSTAVSGGSNATASGAGSTAVGDSSVASSTNATAVGFGAGAITGSGATCVGRSSGAEGADATCVGASALAANDGSVALGGSSVANADGAIALGVEAENSTADSFLAGSASYPVNSLDIYHGQAGRRPAPVLLCRVYVDLTGNYTIATTAFAAINLLQQDTKVGSGLTVSSNRVTVDANYGGNVARVWYCTEPATLGTGGARAVGARWLDSGGTPYTAQWAASYQGFAVASTANAEARVTGNVGPFVVTAADYVEFMAESGGGITSTILSATYTALVVELWTD